jgi:hypothetical protein
VSPHKKSSRDTAGHITRHDRKANSPPEGEAWAWVTLPMMQSAAYRALSPSARRVLDRIVREHMEQGGKENGRLKVTWRNFRDAGVLDRRITGAIAEVEALGWAKRTTFGRRVCLRPAGPRKWGSLDAEVGQRLRCPPSAFASTLPCVRRCSARRRLSPAACWPQPWPQTHLRGDRRGFDIGQIHVS